MASTDWENLGENIRNVVEDAVKSQDYEKLSQNISDVVNTTFNSVSDGINKSINAVNQNVRAYDSRVNKTVTYSSVNSRVNPSVNNRTVQFQKERKNPKESTDLTLYKNIGGQKATAIAEMAVGYSIAGLTGISTFVTFVVGLAVGMEPGLTIATAITGGFTALFGAMASIGRKKYAMTDRFQAYKRALAGKEYVNLDQLAKITHKSIDYIKKDIEEMIRKNWFKQGHLDNQKSCLMITEKVYKEYQNNLVQKNELLIEEKKKQEEYNNNKEVYDVLKTGNEYIEKIRHCNDMIPGEEMSEKILKIEILVKRIFERVEKHPESISDIRKMMDYYLPTTVKLLEAYEELDNQPIAGDNIINSKKEIEESLTMLNQAFEKLLDELFKETAWDVSTDISVLNTILTQDGLKQKDF